MYTVTVRDHIMVAHSLKGAVFGPAQRLHGATFVVDVEFRRLSLDSDSIDVDIGKATEGLRTILADLNFRNLDEEPTLKGTNTTTEVLAKVIYDRVAAAIHKDQLGANARGIDAVRVTLHESHVASASFEGRLADAR